MWRRAAFSDVRQEQPATSDGAESMNGSLRRESENPSLHLMNGTEWVQREEISFTEWAGRRVARPRTLL